MSVGMAMMAAVDGGGSDILYFDNDADAKFVSDYSRNVLRPLLIRAGVKLAFITSTYRSPQDQARVMLGNLKVDTPSMYGDMGQSVEQVGMPYVRAEDTIKRGINQGFDPNRPLPKAPQPKAHYIRLMAAKIDALQNLHGTGCVSHHQIDPARTNVIDISASRLAPSSAMAPFIAALTDSMQISRIGLPKGIQKTSAKHFRESVHCIHVEIPQPQLDLYRPGRYDNIA